MGLRKLEFDMSSHTRLSSIAVAAILGIAVNGYLAIPALSASPPSQVATQSHFASPLHAGDLVRVRSGGPLMTVTGIQGDQVNCSWTDWNGDLKSESFPIAVLSVPVTIPPPDPSLEQDERATDQYYEKHCPSGVVSITGKFTCAY
jgi:uncharacterized protein YodC (DUF2158 family)